LGTCFGVIKTQNFYSVIIHVRGGGLEKESTAQL
jgi:hypothetical protein